MIKHIVAWNFAENAEGRDRAANVALVKDALNALVGAVPTIREFEVVTPQPDLESSFDLVLYSTFNNEADLQAYVVHPEHQAVAKLIGLVRRERFAIDFDPAELR